MSWSTVLTPNELALLTRCALAADRQEIMQLASRFDNALDAEDPRKFTSVFLPDGILAGFWGESVGYAAIEQAFHFMLSTFAKNRRHVVSNHEIQIDHDTATMFSYLTVFDQQTNSSIGTATFHDQLIRCEGSWRFNRRTLTADPNVQPLIDSIRIAS